MVCVEMEELVFCFNGGDFGCIEIEDVVVVVVDWRSW